MPKTTSHTELHYVPYSMLGFNLAVLQDVIAS